MDRLILASSSPRRQEILRQLKIDFEVKKPECDEDYPQTLPKNLVPKFLAEKKVRSVLERHDSKNSFILGSDTIVLHDGKLLGKPKNREEAFAFLKSLQGSAHSVISGIAVYGPRTGAIETAIAETKVFFRTLSDDEIQFHLNQNEWQDAAGGYKIQERGSFLVKKIEGSYTNVVGLPTFELYDILKKLGFNFAN